MIRNLQGIDKDDSYRQAFPYVVVLYPVSTGLAAQSFTLNEALSAPFSSQLSVAPAGGTLAWVMNQQGRRNLWVATRNADGKTFNSRS